MKCRKLVGKDCCICRERGVSLGYVDDDDDNNDNNNIVFRGKITIIFSPQFLGAYD